MRINAHSWLRVLLLRLGEVEEVVVVVVGVAGVLE